MKKLLYFVLMLGIWSCGTEKPKKQVQTPSKDTFNVKSLVVQDAGVKKVRGQVLYLPVYSEIPYLMDSTKLSASAFVAVHNTDFSQNISIRKVLFFDNDGHLVKDFLLDKTLILKPLAATHFFIPYEDQSGTGANFILEWTSETPVTEPLIESVIVNLQSVHSMSFLSQGKVVRETK